MGKWCFIMTKYIRNLRNIFILYSQKNLIWLHLQVITPSTTWLQNHYSFFKECIKHCVNRVVHWHPNKCKPEGCQTINVLWLLMWGVCKTTMILTYGWDTLVNSRSAHTFTTFLLLSNWIKCLSRPFFNTLICILRTYQWEKGMCSLPTVAFIKCTLNDEFLKKRKCIFAFLFLNL